jgi:type IV pilus assembly protein PilQ
MYKLLITAIVLLLGLSSNAFAAQLTDISFAELPGEKTEIRLQFDQAPMDPKGFTINKPARVVLDFQDVDNKLAQKKFDVDVGEVQSAVVVAGGGRTRLIVNLENAVPYTSTTVGNEIVVHIGTETVSNNVVGNVSSQPSSVAVGQPSAPIQVAEGQNAITNVDFRRGTDGEGKVIISLSNPNVAVDVEKVSTGVDVRFVGVSLPSELRRKLDVVDFATPVEMLSSSQSGRDSVVRIDAGGEYDYLAYQADNEYVISVKPLTQREIEEKKDAFAYTGNRLSLNFQDIQVRSVLQIIADFTELNLVASDTVGGSITLRLENVPWDQALDIVLKTKGLDKRQIGNVLMVAPAAEIAERERQEIETKKQLQELAPLRTEYIRIRYANARELFSLFMSRRGGDGGTGGGVPGAGGLGNQGNSTGSILSERGQAIVDERTNSIILTDTEEKISAFRELIERIDIPVQQVLIEARIVIGTNSFRKELGVRIAGDGVDTRGDRIFEYTGSMESLYANENGGITGTFVDSDGDGSPDGAHSFPENTLVDLDVAGAFGSFATNIISSNFLLGLELSALEESGFAEIVSQPKVITGDKQQATIQSGTQIPYQEESASGGTTTAFEEAVLSLDVTPQITPDDRVVMDLVITQDSISGVTSNGVPIIDITQLETQVLVADGDTVVLGGIYQTESIDGVRKVPLLGDIPFLGRLFRNDIRDESKREILIFITPKILSSNYVE